ncbi:hypothetical protein [Acuticoccus sediminis]|nr:hypothetical protein [Acuticoccus sediminis]
MARRPLKDDLRDEFSYAVADIRGAWERAWFSQTVTPGWHEQHWGGHGGDMSESQPKTQAVVHADNPHVPSAIEGIGHSGGDDFHPDHTRDAVRTFYGQQTQQDWASACRNVFGEGEEADPADDALAPERGPRLRR